MYFPEAGRHPHTQLIPEMNFVCSGIITGYTATLIDQNGGQDPVIQIWRKNVGSYYKTSPDIAIDSALCVDGLTRLTEVSGGHGVFHCNLTQSTRVSVQAGDILGLELPEREKGNNDIRLAFATVSSGPISYVFDTSESQVSYNAIWRHNQIVRELPQITLEIIGSGKYININFMVACMTLWMYLIDQDKPHSRLKFFPII